MDWKEWRYFRLEGKVLELYREWKALYDRKTQELAEFMASMSANTCVTQDRIAGGGTQVIGVCLPDGAEVPAGWKLIKKYGKQYIKPTTKAEKAKLEKLCIPGYGGTESPRIPGCDGSLSNRISSMLGYNASLVIRNGCMWSMYIEEIDGKVYAMVPTVKGKKENITNGELVELKASEYVALTEMAEAAKA